MPRGKHKRKRKPLNKYWIIFMIIVGVGVCTLIYLKKSSRSVYNDESVDGYLRIGDVENFSFEVPEGNLKDIEEIEDFTDESSYGTNYLKKSEESYYLVKMDSYVICAFRQPLDDLSYNNVTQQLTRFQEDNYGLRINTESLKYAIDDREDRIVDKIIFTNVSCEVVPATEFYNDMIGDAVIMWDSENAYFLFAGTVGRKTEDIESGKQSIIHYISKSASIVDPSMKSEKIDVTQDEGVKQEILDREESIAEENLEEAKMDELEVNENIAFEVVTSQGKIQTKTGCVEKVLFGNAAEECIDEKIQDTIYKSADEAPDGYEWNVAFLTYNKINKKDIAYIDIKVLSEEHEPFDTGKRTYQLLDNSEEYVVFYLVPTGYSYILSIGSGSNVANVCIKLG